MAMSEEDDSDADSIGEILILNEQMSTELLFWQLVCSLHLPLAEIDSWTLGEMRKAKAVLDMKSTYKRAWQTYFERKNMRQ